MEKLFGLAKSAQQLFTDFYLAVGTAIMLKHQHRKCIGIDLFKEKLFSFNLAL